MAGSIKLSEKNKDFFENVYEVVKLIPAGRVTSYGAVANYLGMGRAARMVGWAMNASFSHHEYVPAHRVLNRNGMLTGKHHFAEPHQMQDLLEAEGTKVEKDKVVEWKERYWDPNIELAL